MPKVYKKNILIKYLHCQMSTWWISMSSFQFLIWRLKISDSSAFNDLIRHLGILVGPDALEFRYPYTQELMQPNWIRRRGSVPTVRILCVSGVRITILESGFENPNQDVCITFGAIRGSGSRLDPELFAFCILRSFLISGSGSGFASHPTALEKF